MDRDRLRAIAQLDQDGARIRQGLRESESSDLMGIADKAMEFVEILHSAKAGDQFVLGVDGRLGALVVMGAHMVFEELMRRDEDEDDA